MPYFTKPIMMRCVYALVLALPGCGMLALQFFLGELQLAGRMDWVWQAMPLALLGLAFLGIYGGRWIHPRRKKGADAPKGDLGAGIGTFSAIATITVTVLSLAGLLLGGVGSVVRGRWIFISLTFEPFRSRYLQHPSVVLWDFYYLSCALFVAGLSLYFLGRCRKRWLQRRSAGEREEHGQR